MPELVFYHLRELAGVVTQEAFVNSSAVITLALAGYLALFVRRRCLEAEVDPADAVGKAFQVGILALIAFLEIPRTSGAYETTTLLHEFINYQDIVTPEGQRAVLLVGSAKLLAWFYLFSLLFRYYIFEKPRVFARMASMFPSSYRAEDHEGDSAKADSQPSE